MKRFVVIAAFGLAVACRVGPVGAVPALAIDQGDIDDLQQEIDDAQDDLDQANEDIEQAQDDIDEVRSQVDELEDEANDD